MKKAFLKGTLLQFAVLLGLWLLLSGRIDLFHVSAGVFSALLVTLMHVRVNRHLYFDKGIAAGRSLRVVRLARYIPWLLKQIVLSSLQVAYAVLHPRMPINPSLVRFRVRLPNITARVILGNSITLTPGTLTLRIKDDEFLVHSLMEASHAGLIDGSLPRHVARLYGDKSADIVSEVKIFHKARHV
ncbi:MAG: Na+/H+ antiporter subunit E [Candidatus Aminicenantes bacterium]|nr:Na+/H+ antiporter subunit E [Candidatus Aminicenantes bacterium]